MAVSVSFIIMFTINNYIQRARLLFQQGRIKDAEREIGFALRENPDDGEALLLLAECKIEGRHYDEAKQLLHTCIAAMPYYHRVYYLLAFCFYQMSKKTEALQELKKATELNPEASAYFGLYAYIYLDMHLYGQALEKANEGLAVYAEDLTCLNARSQALIRLKNKDEAYETIREALAIDPDDDFTHTNVGWIYLEKGKHKDARVHFREALRIKPTNKRAKGGYKESLKAKLLPYRWLLMFSLWLSAKSKKARWITIIVIWASIRLLSGISSFAGADVLAYSLIGLYLLFVIFSWVGASMANIVLLFSQEGRYVLTNLEKKIAGCIVFLFACCISTLLFANYLPTVTSENKYFVALIFLTLVLPVSRFEYLNLIRRKKLVIYYSTALIALGVVSAAGLLAGVGTAQILMLVYFAALVIYTWGFAFI